MPIRNPFARRPSPAAANPAIQDEKRAMGGDPAHPGFERVDTVGATRTSTSSVFSSIRGGRRSQDTGEYKMSVVDDSGVYLPPSPVEREPVWPRRYLSRTSSDHRRSMSSGGGDIAQFPISRESFDSYRRSFVKLTNLPVIRGKQDITARTPVRHGHRPRQSLDSHPHMLPLFSTCSDLSSASSRSTTSWGASTHITTPEEDCEMRFEEVQLDDDENEEGKDRSGAEDQQQKGYLSGLRLGRGLMGHHDEQEQHQQHQQQKKRNLFSFGRSNADTEHEYPTPDLHPMDASRTAFEESPLETTTTSASTNPSSSASTGMSRFLPPLPVISLPLGGGKKKVAGGSSAQEAELKFMGMSSSAAGTTGTLQTQEVKV
ncbi:hypothetical protein VTJ49DRAFT_1988 [Mycothermus thermophilus]|uniref:Uncharacterized protein n=1 Tax=Humicola insolens TaxID=85995 RepID=A0ABR3VCT4_HUMIN